MKRCLLCVFILLWMMLLPASAETLPVMQLHQINIGCADAYLLFSGDTVILVDCGLDTDRPSETNEPLLSYLKATGIDHVDAHFVTHYHNDHALNIDLLSGLYGTEHTVVYGPSVELPERFLPLPNGTYQHLRDGDEVQVGPFAITCVGPAWKDTITGETNHDSLNLLITYGSRRLVMTGDWADPSLVERHADVLTNVDVLSFPHHGLRPLCIHPRTYKMLNPQLVLVPGRDIAWAWDFSWVECNSSAKVLGDQHGNIVVTSDGESLDWEYKVTPGTYKYQGSKAQ